ncbi:MULTISPECIES: envelope stress response membrane protein PspB [Gluconobacter]|uniref:envelope stress response membrane protein PspB n=1 Tax=Gluconobacter TaxID=441 RepID=UPI000B754367|nr:MULTISPECIES: envelope stress response membrane protein PspB [Gluconobacter]MBS1037941.1 envelope stress response membrane protein PspB [Gluconobacter cerinus]OUJ08747.1 hypothetical protein HK24_06060 [Gluconobacter sp. DsW_058]GFE95915.1 hypothetical protein DmGdi_09880 [Gluconobacter sp. Gdi]
MNEDIVALVLLFGFIPALVLGPRLLRARTGNLPNQGIADPHLQAALTQAEAHATRLEERIDQLERILDEDIPGWRARSSR